MCSVPGLAFLSISGFSGEDSGEDTILFFYVVINVDKYVAKFMKIGADGSKVLVKL